MGIKLVDKQENIFGDNIGFVEQWDLSKANLNEKNRIQAITQVASICYQNPNALNSESLYNRLICESIGLPSSSFEFVPILFELRKITWLFFSDATDGLKKSNCLKYGEIIEDGKYLLTNIRAVINDKEKFGIDLTKHFNTKEECEIIAKHFKVFMYKVDLPTRSQMVRHRVDWQELSRRYVSGKRVPFEFHISDKMKNIKSKSEVETKSGLVELLDAKTEDIINLCVEHYYTALKQGVKPEEARRIIPQAAYTKIWGAWQPTQLENFLKLRLAPKAEWAIRQVAEAMKNLIEGCIK
ncbi:MAG: FAD-dependent thymidylate synthase [Sulfurovaceae bacterium]